jgi:two-component system OmpR family sensor kinase
VRFFSRLSIRWRITLGSFLLAAVFFGAGVIAFRFQVQSILHTTASSLLASDARQFEMSLTQTAGATVDRPVKGQLVAVLDPQGIVRVNTLPASLTKRLSSLVKYDQTTHTLDIGDDTYVIRNETVTTDAGNWHVVTARNQEASALLLDDLTVALLVAASVLVVGFGAASWILTGAALRPVTRMRKRAEELGAQSSTQPLPVGSANDEISALATTLNEFIAQLRQAAERERQMVSDASHELRTPIAVLKTQLELAHLNRGDAAALEEEISAAERSVERLAALATSLLQLSQVESAHDDASSTPAELAEELASAVDRARVLAVAKSITVDFDSFGAEGSHGYAVSAANFGRLIDNLTSNAITALPDDGFLRLDLRTSGAALTLTVSDSGPGIPDDFIPIAFDRFSRPDESRAGASGGSGLGLAIVHAIVTAAHGTITLENRSSGGLRVTVAFPPNP